MIRITPASYDRLPLDRLTGDIQLTDHLGGFDISGQNFLLSTLSEHAKQQNNLYNVIYHQILPTELMKKNYPWLSIQFSSTMQQQMNFMYFKNYKTHPELTFEHFLCSFNGSPHVSRKLLSAIIKKFGWWNSLYCSKNFTCDIDNILGHINDYVSDDCSGLYNKLFNVDENFCKTIYSFGHMRFDHTNNIYNLEEKLTKNFLHIVSETMATSYYPFVTEKFLYSIVTRGLFLAYAQPGWHDHLEKYYGFKKYNKLFNYQFDSIQNPVVRLVELMSMISKFSVLSSDDWRDLY